jgi:hypothetical protein
MKRRRKKSEHMRAIHLWEWNEVARAGPYLRSVSGTLREHWLDVLSAQRQLKRTEKEKAPAKRQQLLEQETRLDECQRAQGKFDDALEELNKVDVFLLDPVKGQALIPFRKEDDLAWYVFDHFAPDGLVGWRSHSDPIEECRPLASLSTAAANDVVAT